MGASSSKQFFVHNNVKLSSADEDRVRYLFVDSSEHRADRILMGSLIPTTFEKLEEPVAEEGFELRLCSFRKRYESWFLCCMSDLEWVLQAEGNYVKACEKLLGVPVVLRAELGKLAEQNACCEPFTPKAGLQLLGVNAADLQ